MSHPSRLLLPAIAILFGGAALANDFPTVDRVTYVEECMARHPGPHFEMLNKCSCALDSLARKIKHAEYVEMSTAVNANSISGERGNTIRDTEVLQKKIKRYRELQASVLRGCFIDPEAR